MFRNMRPIFKYNNLTALTTLSIYSIIFVIVYIFMLEQNYIYCEDSIMPTKQVYYRTIYNEIQTEHCKSLYGLNYNTIFDGYFTQKIPIESIINSFLDEVELKDICRNAFVKNEHNADVTKIIFAYNDPNNPDLQQPAANNNSAVETQKPNNHSNANSNQPTANNKDMM